MNSWRSILGFGLLSLAFTACVVGSTDDDDDDKEPGVLMPGTGGTAGSDGGFAGSDLGGAAGDSGGGTAGFDTGGFGGEDPGGFAGEGGEGGFAGAPNPTFIECDVDATAACQECLTCMTTNTDAQACTEAYLACEQDVTCSEELACTINRLDSTPGSGVTFEDATELCKLGTFISTPLNDVVNSCKRMDPNENCDQSCVFDLF